MKNTFFINDIPATQSDLIALLYRAENGEVEFITNKVDDCVFIYTHDYGLEVFA